jgi:hypothetical protein
MNDPAFFAGIFPAWAAGSLAMLIESAHWRYRVGSVCAENDWEVRTGPRY